MSTNELEQLRPIVDGINGRLPGAIQREEDSFGDLVLVVDRKQSHDVLRDLREQGFDLLADIAGVDLLNIVSEVRSRTSNAIREIRPSSSTCESSKPE